MSLQNKETQQQQGQTQQSQQPQQFQQMQGVPPQMQQIQGGPPMQQIQGLPQNQQVQGLGFQGYAPQQQQQQQQQVPSINNYPQGLNNNNFVGYNNNNNTNFVVPPAHSRAAHSGVGFTLLKFEEAPTTKPDKTLEKITEDSDKKTETETDADADKKIKLAAIIITLCDGSTYDALFSSVEQDAGDGSRVAVYSAKKTDIKDLIDNIKEFDAEKVSARSDDLHLLLSDLKEIEDVSCVAINYECCSECSDTGFSGMSNQQIISELQFFLERGYLAMYSDFSLKAIINAWNAIGDRTVLGPNPFVRTGDFSGSVTVNFNPYTLKNCISSQLQAVGELCPDQDFCTVHCMGGTLRYSIKKKFTKNGVVADCSKLPYNIEILTIAQFGKHSNSCSIQVPDFPSKHKQKDKGKDKKKNSGFFSMFGFGKGDQDKDKDKEKDETEKHSETKTDEQENKNDDSKAVDKDVEATKLPMKKLFGDAGHVVLEYGTKSDDDKEGKTDKGDKELSGSILLSMTHWCELVKLGDQINDDVLFRVAAKNMGARSKAYQEMQTTYNAFGGKNATGQQYQQQQAWISKTANKMVQQQAPCNNMMNSSYSKGGY